MQRTRGYRDPYGAKLLRGSDAGRCFAASRRRSAPGGLPFSPVEVIVEGGE
ncbi:MAG: hypothetical protein AAFQ14_13590 [Cyanobacteria bacterium J06621_12]